MERHLQLRQQTDETLIAQIFAGTHKDMPVDQVLQGVERVNRLIDPVGKKSLELDSVREVIKTMEADDTLGPEDTVEMKMREQKLLAELEQQLEVISQGFEQELGLERASPMNMRMTKLMIDLAKVRYTRPG